MNKDTVVSLCYGCAALNTFNVLKYLYGFYRRSISYGWAFDTAFGFECFVNLLSDYVLLASIKGFPLPSFLLGRDVLVLFAFVVWNATSVGICYISSAVLAVHFANTVDLKEAAQELKEQNVDEANFRKQMMMTTLIVFTLMAAIKGSIVYNLYAYYKKVEQGGDVESPTAFYFPADPNAPVPFLPPETKKLGAARGAGKTGGAYGTAAPAHRLLRPVAPRFPPLVGFPPAAAVASARRASAVHPYEVAVLRTPFMVLHMPPEAGPAGGPPSSTQPEPPTPAH